MKVKPSGDVRYTDCKHEKEEITLEVIRYKVKGIPTCYSWAGDEDHPAEICQFLLQQHFGTQFICGFTQQRIHMYEKEGIKFVLKPTKDCPLWKD